MTYVELALAVPVYGLAAGAAVDLWRNGSIFADLRAKAEAAAVGHPRLEELLGCELCMQYHTAMWLVLAFLLPAAWLPAWLAAAWQAPVGALAVGRATWLINGLLPGRLRYDRPRGFDAKAEMARQVRAVEAFGRPYDE